MTKIWQVVPCIMTWHNKLRTIHKTDDWERYFKRKQIKNCFKEMKIKTYDMSAFTVRQKMGWLRNNYGNPIHGKTVALNRT